MGKVRELLNDLEGGNCALPLALEAMGERRSFMILRAAFNGVHHFEEYQQELNIARNILSNRLSKLVDHGIMARQVMAERSEEHTSEPQSLMRISYAVFCLQKKTTLYHQDTTLYKYNIHSA